MEHEQSKKKAADAAPSTSVGNDKPGDQPVVEPRGPPDDATNPAAPDTMAIHEINWIMPSFPERLFDGSVWKEKETEFDVTALLIKVIEEPSDIALA
jgi:hypothetical protein